MSVAILHDYFGDRKTVPPSEDIGKTASATQENLKIKEAIRVCPGDLFIILPPDEIFPSSKNEAVSARKEDLNQIQTVSRDQDNVNRGSDRSRSDKYKDISSSFSWVNTERETPDALEKALQQLEEDFITMLLRKIDLSGLKASDVYHAANIERRLWSKLRNNKVKPKKSTVLAFAVALKLSIEETNEMLMKAGFSLSHSSKQDIIVKYFLENEIYDIGKINTVLDEHGEGLLGND